MNVLRNKWLFVILFIAGLGILLYPIVANLFSTKAHVKQIDAYETAIRELSEEEKIYMEEQARKHNESIKEEEATFIDPFANGTSSAGNRSYYDALDIGDSMAVLEIPKLGIELPIYHGTDEGVLSRGVGHMENTALPVGGEGTHSVLTAHRGLPSSTLFRHLDKLDPGDVFFINVLGEVHAYEVREQKIVWPDETDWLVHEEGKELTTLLTCEPYMINSHRLLVTAEKIEYEEAAIKAERQRPQQGKYVRPLLIGAALLLLLLLLNNRRKRKGDLNEE